MDEKSDKYKKSLANLDTDDNKKDTESKSLMSKGILTGSDTAHDMILML